ncbi:MAG: hypothetical protein M0C28_44505 [Candidatus Moduliflexus flocculans]|nr:hypothetical protein [Candidatus Moduliflexus flocculans]
MDKGVFKDVMVANDIPVVDTLVVLRAEIEKDMAAVIAKAEALGEYPLFAKPAISAPRSVLPNATTAPTCRKA